MTITVSRLTGGLSMEEEWQLISGNIKIKVIYFSWNAGEDFNKSASR